MTLSFVDMQPRRNDYSFSDYVKKKYVDTFEQIVKGDSNFKWMNEEQIKRVCYKASEIYDTDFERNGYVGIAIAGYGEQDIYPQMIHLHVSGYINGKLRFFLKEKAEISEKNSASVTPLAQTDVMQTFLFGINGKFLEDLAEAIPKQIGVIIDRVGDDCFTEGNKNVVRSELNTVTESIINHMTAIAGNNYMLPIMQSVSSLPIEELALLAESMINITSLRRKVALDRNIGTVGGPIDVSIISKGDGFIWLKRKHYFDPKYNPQYFYSHFDKVKRGIFDDD